MTEKRYEWCADDYDVWDSENEMRIFESDIVDEMNKLNDEKEAWKQSCCSNSNFNSILLHELDIAREQGYEVSNPFKQFMTFKKENRFEIRYMFKNNYTQFSLIPPSLSEYTKMVIYDNEDKLPLPFEITGNSYILAKDLCDKLNKLATIKENNKPKPLKTEILEILNKIDEPQYEMANKIKKQKQHIKDLENKIRLLKRDNHSLQRNYCKKTTDLNQIKEERDYYQQKLISWRENGYELP